MIPLESTQLTEPPANGLVYSEEQFGPLPAAAEDGTVDEGGKQKVLYNVMWVDWGLEYSSRKGIGQIHRDGWELADSLVRRIKLR